MLEVKNEEIRSHFQDDRCDYMDCEVGQATVTNLGTLRITVENGGYHHLSQSATIPRREGTSEDFSEIL
jgi:hypothetical protein